MLETKVQRRVARTTDPEGKAMPSIRGLFGNTSIGNLAVFGDKRRRRARQHEAHDPELL